MVKAVPSFVQKSDTPTINFARKAVFRSQPASAGRDDAAVVKLAGKDSEHAAGTVHRYRPVRAPIEPPTDKPAGPVVRGNPPPLPDTPGGPITRGPSFEFDIPVPVYPQKLPDDGDLNGGLRPAGTFETFFPAPTPSDPAPIEEAGTPIKYRQP